MQRIIVLAGQMGHGKDTAALALLNVGYTRAPLAANLKDMIRTFLRNLDYKASFIEEVLEGDRKGEIIPGIDKTARHMMQTLGTEWGRKLIKDTLWLDAWAVRFCAPAQYVVTDCRFANEAEYLKRMGAEIFVVRRPGFTKPSAFPTTEQGQKSIFPEAVHASEDLAWAAGYPVIWNDGTVEDLHKAVLAEVRP